MTQDMRGAFEKWAKHEVNLYSFERGNGKANEYWESDTHSAWRAFQAGSQFHDEEVKRLRDALQWYADPENYAPQQHLKTLSGNYTSPIEMENVTRAKQALEGDV